MMKFKSSVIFAVPAFFAPRTHYPDQFQLAFSSSRLLGLIALQSLVIRNILAVS